MVSDGQKIVDALRQDLAPLIVQLQITARENALVYVWASVFLAQRGAESAVQALKSLGFHLSPGRQLHPHFKRLINEIH